MRLLTIASLYPAPSRPAFGRFVQNQTRALAARGDWDITVMNPISLAPWPLQRDHPLRATPPLLQDAPRLTIHHRPIPRISGLLANISPLLVARAVLPLARRLHAEQPFDMVDAQFFFPDGPAAAVVAQALDLPLAIKARGSDIHYWGGRSTARRQMLSAAHRADALLAVSAAMAGDMAALGMPAERITPHYTGLDRMRFYPRSRMLSRAAVVELGVPADGRLIVSVGALLAIKGQALAIEALPSLPEDVRLALIGSGEEEEALRALAARLGLEDRVLFLGPQGHDAVPLLLCAADAMVLPSEREGLANAWIEALACGTPIVITDVGGAREVVDRPAAGRLVDRTPAAIAGGLNEVLADPARQADVAASVARFSWEANAAAMADLYRAAVLTHRARAI